MIWNIIDSRTRKYRWKNINAIVEPTSNDNFTNDADQAEEYDDAWEYDERENISVAEAVAWATSIPYPVTLYLYDEGDGTADLNR